MSLTSQTWCLTWLALSEERRWDTHTHTDLTYYFHSNALINYDKDPGTNIRWNSGQSVFEPSSSSSLPLPPQWVAPPPPEPQDDDDAIAQEVEVDLDEEFASVLNTATEDEIVDLAGEYLPLRYINDAKLSGGVKVYLLLLTFVDR